MPGFQHAEMADLIAMTGRQVGRGVLAARVDPVVQVATSSDQFAVRRCSPTRTNSWRVSSAFVIGSRYDWSRERLVPARE